jgi:hypothetical protein
LWYWRSYCFEPYDIWLELTRSWKILLLGLVFKLLCRHHKTRYCRSSDYYKHGFVLWDSE